MGRAMDVPFDCASVQADRGDFVAVLHTAETWCTVIGMRFGFRAFGG